MVTETLEIISFYKFFNIEESKLEPIVSKLTDTGHFLGIRGLFLVGVEGCNATLSGSPAQIEEYKRFVETTLNSGEFFYKNSQCKFYPFHDLKIKIREEIVSLGRSDLVPTDTNFHLSPKEWHRVIAEEDPLVIDTRNNYEYSIGKFKNAVNPNLREFNQFPNYMEKSGVEKDKKVLIYCTGGIRCEKALLDMHEQGFNNVYQLDGGIINYIEKYPEGHFDGECFVFDYRVALDKDLAPTTRYKLCPHCGDPGDQQVVCIQCGREEVVCTNCIEKGEVTKTCSKNCAHHFKLGHNTTRPHLDSHRKREDLRAGD